MGIGREASWPRASTQACALHRQAHQLQPPMHSVCARHAQGTSLFHFIAKLRPCQLISSHPGLARSWALWASRTV